jgi:hypothetical protein
MVEFKIPFLVDKETRELAEVGKDWLSGEDTFWVQFFLIILVFSVPAAIGYYTGWLWFGIAPHWYAGTGLFFAVVWAGMNKWWDGQKRKSFRMTSLAFDGTVADLVGWPIPQSEKDGKLLHPELVVYSQGVRAWMRWVPTRAGKIINRADGILYANEKHVLSNTMDKELIWEELPRDVQDSLRRYRKELAIRFTEGNWKTGRPIIGTRFYYGDQPRWRVFADQEYSMDVDVIAQREAAETQRTAAETTGAHSLGMLRNVSKSATTAAVRQAKKSPIATQPAQETSEEEAPFE